MNILGEALSIIVSYLLGSIPFAYLFVRIMKGLDIREQGSGNVGATNVARVIGKGPAIAVFILDFLKGTAAVTIIPVLVEKIFPGYLDGREYIYVLAGGAAIVGHIWTIFLKFRGGKGVSTTAGVMAGLAPLVFFSALVVWIFVFYVWKYVSVASISAAVALPLLALISGRGFLFVVFCAAICMLGVYAHRGNIKRLLAGTETRIVKVKKS